MEETKPNSVVRDWVSYLSFCEQVVLFSAVRGCDTAPKDHASKPLIAAIRGAILYPAFNSMIMPDPGSSQFMSLDIPAGIPRIEELPVHWAFHVMHACEILGYRHPDAKARLAWNRLYLQFCRKFHVNPETKEQMTDRLKGELG